VSVPEGVVLASHCVTSWGFQLRQMAHAEASGICADRGILVVSAGAGDTHLVSFVGAGWPLAGAVRLMATGFEPGLR
jgi:hypothetical protein